MLGPTSAIRADGGGQRFFRIDEFGDDAAIWAHLSLVEKNRLTTADAQCVEDAFQARLATFATRTAADTVHQTPAESEQPLTPHGAHPGDPRNCPQSKLIDKSVLAVPEPRRVRDRARLSVIAPENLPN